MFINTLVIRFIRDWDYNNEDINKIVRGQHDYNSLQHSHRGLRSLTEYRVAALPSDCHHHHLCLLLLLLLPGVDLLTLALGTSLTLTVGTTAVAPENRRTGSTTQLYSSSPGWMSGCRSGMSGWDWSWLLICIYIVEQPPCHNQIIGFLQKSLKIFFPLPCIIFCCCVKKVM